MCGILEETIENMSVFNADRLNRIIKTMAEISTLTNGLDWIPDNKIKMFNLTWTAVAIKQLPNFDYDHLATSIWGLGALNHHNLEFEKAWIAVAIKQLDHFATRDLANSIFALANLNHHDPEFEKAWVAAATNKLDDFTPKDLANNIWGLANLNHHDPEFEKALVAAVTNKLDNFTTQELANSINAFAQLNIKDSSLVENILIALQKIPINYFLNLSNPIETIYDLEKARQDWGIYQGKCQPQNNNSFYNALTPILGLENQQDVRNFIADLLEQFINNDENQNSELYNIAMALISNEYINEIILPDRKWVDNTSLILSIFNNQIGSNLQIEGETWLTNYGYNNIESTTLQYINQCHFDICQ